MDKKDLRQETRMPALRPFIVAAAAFLMSCSHVPAEPLSAGDATTGSVNFTVPGVDDVQDLWGNPSDPDLVLFFGGNEFMVLPELLAAFRKEYPQYRRIFCETLPPGILAGQMKTGKLVVGNLEITLRPDIVTGGRERIERMEKSGQVTRTRTYAGNRLAIMVRQGNPKGIESLRDLQRKDVNVSMPDSSIEDIGKKIEEAFGKAGGGLDEKVLSAKVAEGSTFITRIHHRQTPMRILQRQSDAGPVWATEAIYQRSIGAPIEGVAIAEPENVEARSVAAVMADAPHPRAARDFLDFLAGKSAREIYRKYGFLSP